MRSLALQEQITNHTLKLSGCAEGFFETFTNHLESLVNRFVSIANRNRTAKHTNVMNCKSQTVGDKLYNQVCTFCHLHCKGES